MSWLAGRSDSAVSARTSSFVVTLAVATLWESANADRSPSGYRCSHGRAPRPGEPVGSCVCDDGFHSGRNRHREAVCKPDRSTSPQLTPAPAPPPDRDGDGVSNDSDRCPDDPEVRNAYEDEDGCPDLAPNPPVSPASVSPSPHPAVLSQDVGTNDPFERSLGDAVPEPALPRPSEGGGARAEAGSSGRRRLVLGLGVASLVSFGAAVVLELEARDSYDEYIRTGGSEGAYETANGERHAAVGLAVVGAALGVATVYLWQTGHRSTKGGSVVALPVVTHSFAGASLSLGF